MQSERSSKPGIRWATWPLWTVALVLAGCAAPGTPGPGAGREDLAILTERGIYLISRGAVNIVPGSEVADTAAWDADGTHFLLSDGQRLLELPSEGGRASAFGGVWHGLRFPAASPDGRHIAFSGSRGAGWRVYVCERDGSNVRDVAAGYGPAWSGNSRTLYFETEGGLRALDLQTGTERAFLPDHEAAHTVRTSPDGRRAAFSEHKGLRLADLETGVVVPLTDGAAYDRFVSFSPDGRQVAFFRQESDDSGTHDRIILLDLESRRSTVVWEDDALLPLFRPRRP